MHQRLLSHKAGMSSPVHASSNLQARSYIQKPRTIFCDCISCPTYHKNAVSLIGAVKPHMTAAQLACRHTAQVKPLKAQRHEPEQVHRLMLELSKQQLRVGSPCRGIAVVY